MVGQSLNRSSTNRPSIYTTDDLLTLNGNTIAALTEQNTLHVFRKVCYTGFKNISYGGSNLTDTEQRSAAAKFAADWQGHGDEKRETKAI